MCVFNCARWHDGRGVCVCVCACWFVFCLYVDGGVCSGGGWGFGHRGNKPVPGRKRLSFCPLCFLSLPSSSPPPPTATLSLHAFDPSIVRWCTPSCGMLHPNQTQERRWFIERKLKYARLNERPFISDWTQLAEEWNGAFVLGYHRFCHTLHHFIEFWQSFELLCIWCVSRVFTVPWMCL